MDIGRRIRAARIMAGFNQSEFAKKVGVNQGFLSQLENGRRRPSMKTLDALIAALGTNPGVFFSFKPLEIKPLERGDKHGALI